MLLSTYSDNNDFIMSETNDSVGAVIILLLNAFEQSAILTVSYVICKACYALFMVAKNESRSRYPQLLNRSPFSMNCLIIEMGTFAIYLPVLFF